MIFISYITNNYGTRISVDRYNNGTLIIQKKSANISIGKVIGVIDSEPAVGLVFAIRYRFKPLGITLIILGIILAVARGDGITGLVLFIIAGSLVFRYRPAREELTK